MQKNILEYLEKTVKEFTDEIAIIDENRAVSFCALQKESVRIASYLQYKHVKKGLPIGVFLPKSIEAVESCFGVFY